MWALSPDVMAGPYVGSLPSPTRATAPNPLVNSYRTADDRWLYLVCLQADRYWAELCTIVDRPDLAADERFGDMASRAANSAACVAELDAAFGSRPLAEWQERLDGFSGVWSPALSPAEVHEHVQVAANGYLPEITSSDGSTFRLPAPPAAVRGRGADPSERRPRAGPAHRGAAPRAGSRLGGHRRLPRRRSARMTDDPLEP